MDNLKRILGENTSLTEEDVQLVQEAWDKKLSEAKEEITNDIREEFAQKFEHDKSLLVDTLDTFLENQISEEVKELANDKKGLVEERVAYKKKTAEHAKMLEKFVSDLLAKEVAELKEDRDSYKQNLRKLENFTIKQLSEEIGEFQKDKQNLAEQRVKLLSEGKKKLHSTQKKFVKESAKKIDESINKLISKEIYKFREDIEAARKNHFGRKIYEAFASEFMTSYMNEGTELNKLNSTLTQKQQKLEEMSKKLEEQQKLYEKATKEIRNTKDQMQRDKVMSKLLSPLNRENREIMEDILKSVETRNLKESFHKYLPVVLKEGNNGGKDRTSKKQKVLSESKKERTGNRRDLNKENESHSNATNGESQDINEMIRLAGINNRH